MISQALLVIDHGSRNLKANQTLAEVCEMVAKKATGFIVKKAHMECAQPTIEQGIVSCVQAGATSIIAVPYFLAPGRHVSEDIPRLLRLGAKSFPHLSIKLSPPLGPDPLLATILLNRSLQATSL